MSSASVTAWNLYRDYSETLYLPLNSGLGICRIYFSTSVQISGCRLILRMKISPSSQRYGPGQEGYLYGLIFGTCVQTLVQLFFHWCVFSATKEVLQQDSGIITGIQISWAWWLTAADCSSEGAFEVCIFGVISLSFISSLRWRLTAAGYRTLKKKIPFSTHDELWKLRFSKSCSYYTFNSCQGWKLRLRKLVLCVAVCCQHTWTQKLLRKCVL